MDNLEKNYVDWAGTVIKVVERPVCTEWSWGDPNCRSMVRYIYRHHIYYVEPPPPVSIGDQYLFKVKLSHDDNPVICYSNGKYLIELNAKEEIEMKYIKPNTIFHRFKRFFEKIVEDTGNGKL